MGTTGLVTAVAVVAGLAGGCAVLRMPLASYRHRLRGLVAAVAGLTVVGAGGGVALVLLFLGGGLNAFGAIHLAYLGSVVSIPMVGSTLAVRGLRDGELTPWWAMIAAVPLMVPAPVGWWATHVEPTRLQLETVSVPLAEERAGSRPVRIGVLADLQTNDVGSYEHRAVSRLLAEEPDLILLPGDLFQGTPAEFSREEAELRELLARLEAPFGVYFVRGDTDGGVDGRAERALADSQVVVLDDEIIEVEVGDRRLLVGGNRLLYTDPAAVAMRQELESTDEEESVRILVSHRPDVALELAEGSRVDLVVAGHTHGGQVVVPGFGPLLTLSSVPRDVARGGSHELNGNRVYVSPGVGMERGQAPQVRLFSRPTLGILELR